MPNEEAKIKIDGQEYAVPAFDTLTMDEADVLYSYAKVTLDKLGDLDGFHPGVMMGFIHVAIARARPDLKAKEIEEKVRAMKVSQVDEIFRETEGDDVSPPPNETAEGHEPSGVSSELAMARFLANGQAASSGLPLSAIGSD